MFDTHRQSHHPITLHPILALSLRYKPQTSVKTHTFKTQTYVTQEEESLVDPPRANHHYQVMRSA